MPEPIFYIDRISQKKEVEEVYGGQALQFIYGDGWLSRLIGMPLLHLVFKNSLFSSFYGYLQKLPASKRKVQSFIKKFKVDDSEFLENPASFKSFNDFFIRKLKPEVRPIVLGANQAIMPADARYF